MHFESAGTTGNSEILAKANNWCAIVIEGCSEEAEAQRQSV